MLCMPSQRHAIRLQTDCMVFVPAPVVRLPFGPRLQIQPSCHPCNDNLVMQVDSGLPGQQRKRSKTCANPKETSGRAAVQPNVRNGAPMQTPAAAEQPHDEQAMAAAAYQAHFEERKTSLLKLQAAFIQESMVSFLQTQTPAWHAKSPFDASQRSAVARPRPGCQEAVTCEDAQAIWSFVWLPVHGKHV